MAHCVGYGEKRREEPRNAQRINCKLVAAITTEWWRSLVHVSAVAQGLIWHEIAQCPHAQRDDCQNTAHGQCNAHRNTRLIHAATNTQAQCK